MDTRPSRQHNRQWDLDHFCWKERDLRKRASDSGVSTGLQSNDLPGEQ